jgi:hypothetical protein
MNSCDHCLRLESRLQTASDHYVSLITQHDKMIQESSAASAVADAKRKARRRRNAAARLLLAHKSTHEELPVPKADAATQA